jgi:hypothetical protein
LSGKIANELKMFKLNVKWHFLTSSIVFLNGNRAVRETYYYLLLTMVSFKNNSTLVVFNCNSVYVSLSK